MIERIRKLLSFSHNFVGSPNLLAKKNQPACVSDLLSSTALFLISPGRSGTKSLVDLYSRYTSMYCLHSPTPWIASVGYLYHQKRISPESAKFGFYATREPYLIQAYQKQKVFFDGDCKNLPVTTEIADLLPEARFIHLVRRPEYFIQSGLARGYYKTTPHELWGHLTATEFARDESIPLKSQIEKIAFFWNEANCIAEKAKQKLGPHRVATLVAETVFTNPNQAFQALRQLGLESVIQKNSGFSVRKLNSQKRKLVLSAATHDLIENTVRQMCETRSLYYE